MNSIVKEITYAHPPHRVWRALTDPKILAAWLMESDIEPRVGHRFQFRTKPAPGFDGIVHAEVLEADPPKRLVYSWAGGPSMKHKTRVEWTLIPVNGGAGTLLRLKHSGFEGIGGFFLRAMMGGGWGKKLTKPQHFLAELEKIAAAEGNSR